MNESQIESRKTANKIETLHIILLLAGSVAGYALSTGLNSMSSRDVFVDELVDTLVKNEVDTGNFLDVSEVYSEICNYADWMQANTESSQGPDPVSRQFFTQILGEYVRRHCRE